MSASIGEISLLHSLSTLAFSPSGLEALWTFSPSNSLAIPFRSTVMSLMEENRLAPFEGGSESSSRVKADWNCLLQMLAFSLESVLRISFSLGDVVFFKWFDKWPKLFNLFRLRSVGIWSIIFEHKYIGNVFPIGISQYLLNICSEPLVMNLDIRVLWFPSTKVKLMSLFYKPLVASIHGTQYFFWSFLMG